MKLIIVACLVAAALAAPQLRKPQNPNDIIPIISQSNVLNEDGSFQSSYESGDGTRVESQGSLKSLGPEEDGQTITGSYTFQIDGVTYEIRYVADENGYRPEGAHLPTAPPIPEEILKALEYNAAHPEEDNLRRK